MIKTVFWDFNGTILDDVNAVVALNNRVFTRYGLAPFKSVDDYRRVFRFPIREYYKDCGVTDELFEAVAGDWSKEYMMAARDCPIREGILDAVSAFERAGLSQTVISASKRTHLQEQLSWYPPLSGKFQEVLGLDDIYAVSKVHLAVDYCSRHNQNPHELVLIGDTLHDAQVAEAIGSRCLLLEDGHQLRETLLTAGAPVFDSLKKVTEYVLKDAANTCNR